MKWALPRKRTILACHRWLGLMAAVFLLLLSLTGIAINHTEALGLDRKEIRAPIVLARYGRSSPAEIQVYRIEGDATIAHLGEQLFHNGEAIASAGEPLGIVSGGPITVVATAARLLYLTPEGALIETVDTGQLPWKELRAVGRDEGGRAVLITDNGNWRPDADWLTFESYEGRYWVEPLTAGKLSEKTESELLEAYRGGGVSLYRVLLDLHSGRLFGWGGRTVMDLAAVAMVLLIISGIGGWLRKGRSQPRSSNSPEDNPVPEPEIPKN